MSITDIKVISVTNTCKNTNNWRVALFVVCLIFFCLFSMLGLWRHWAYLTSINDLGSFDQVAWMAANGHSLVNTSIFNIPMNWLGFHFQPILFAFVLLYKITPTVNWFVFAQSGALAITAWPVFLIAASVTNSEKAAFMWALAYLCNPFLLNAAAWDFHPVSIAVPFLALGLLAVERRHTMLLIIASIILLACKEHMGLAVAGLGLLYGVRNRAWVTGLGLAMTGVAAFLLIVAVVMPSLSLTEQHLMFGENIGQLGRYAWLGKSPSEVITRIINEPMFVIRTIVSMGGLQYLSLLMTPLLFLPLGSALWLLPAVADLLVNLLSANQMPRSIFSYHSAALIPIFTVAAIHGSCRLARAVGSLDAVRLSYYVLLTSLILAYGFAPIPLYGSANYWKINHLPTAQDPEVSNIRTIIGGASVSAQSNVGSHFSQRKIIYRYPQRVGEADFIILRLQSPAQLLFHHDRGAVAKLTHHLMMEPSEYLDSVRNLLSDVKYGIVFWQDPWLVLQRGEVTDANIAMVLDKIDLLQREWPDSISE